MRWGPLEVELDWREFVRGSSFFVPALDPEVVRKDVLAYTDRLGYTVLTRIVVEAGVYGVRFWRIR